MVLELLALATAIPDTVGVNIAVAEGARQQAKEDRDEQELHRMKDFYIDVYCNAQSRKKDQVNNTIVVLKDGKVCDMPKPKSKSLRNDACSFGSHLKVREQKNHYP